MGRTLREQLLRKFKRLISKLKRAWTNFTFRITHPTSAWWGKAVGIAALGGFISVVSTWRTWASAAAWFGGCYLIWWLRNRHVSNVLTGCASNLNKALESAEKDEPTDFSASSGDTRLMLFEWGIDQELDKALRQLQRIQKYHLYSDPYDIAGSVKALLRVSQYYGVRYNLWANPIVCKDDELIPPTRISDADDAGTATDRKMWHFRNNQDSIRNKLIPMLQMEAQRVST
jgi:hypothetical protein